MPACLAQTVSRVNNPMPKTGRVIGVQPTEPVDTPNQPNKLHKPIPVTSSCPCARLCAQSVSRVNNLMPKAGRAIANEYADGVPPRMSISGAAASGGGAKGRGGMPGVSPDELYSRSHFLSLMQVGGG